MIRMKSPLTILAICIITLSVGTGTYTIESILDNREKKIRILNAQIKEEQERIAVLEADWSYLTRPARIQRLARKNLGLVPIKPQQILSIETLDAHENDQNDNKIYRINLIEEDE